MPIVLQQISGEAEILELMLGTTKGTDSLNYNPLSGIYQVSIRFIEQRPPGTVSETSALPGPSPACYGLCV